MIKIFYSPKSRKDLDRIYDYIYDDLNNPIAAENKIDNGFRFLTCDNYIIFYKNTKEAILIVRILHCLQDYVKYLF